MEIVTPSVGQLFWGGLVFLMLLFLLAKYAWKPIVNAVSEREQNIRTAIELADKTKAEMKELQSRNEDLLKEAKAERDGMIKDAKETANKMVSDAKNDAKNEAAKILADSRSAIASEKAAAISELKTQVASFSLEIAEKIIRQELSSDDKQKTLASKMAKDINLN